MVFGIQITKTITGNHNIMRNWNNKIDQYFEDKVWVKIPKQERTPHTMFVIGFVTALIFCVILISLINVFVVR